MEDDDNPDFQDIRESWQKGSPIGDMVMEYRTVKFTYAGTAPDGWHLVDIGREIIRMDPDKPLTAKAVRLEAARIYKKNIYRIETEGGHVFYEACNDMPEKSDIYKELGASVVLEARFKETGKAML